MHPPLGVAFNSAGKRRLTGIWDGRHVNPGLRKLKSGFPVFLIILISDFPIAT